MADHSQCGGVAEVFVCGCVNQGQPYDFLAANDDGSVGTAVCGDCQESIEMLMSVQHEYAALRKMDEFNSKLIFNTQGGCSICRACARKIGIPDAMPNDEITWQRLVN